MLESLSLAAGLSWGSGLRLYLTVLLAGVFARLGFIHLPDTLSALSSPWVIGVAGVLTVTEFLADKIPAFDLLWSALHTFVRVPIAALLTYRATAQLTPAEQLLATLLGAAIALAAHSGKTAVRAAVTPSPEPFSNISLSLAEDALAISLTWLATRHPYAAGTIALVLVAIVILLARAVICALRARFRGAEKELAN